MEIGGGKRFSVVNKYTAIHLLGMVKNIYRRVFKRRHMSQDLSEEQAGELIENRMEFKLYAAKQHLKNLRNLEQEGGSIGFSKERVRWEMEIESFLFYVVGVRDSFLVKINDKLGLKLKEEEVYMNTIENKLNHLNEQHLLTDLKNFNTSSCFRILKESRDQSTHRRLIEVRFSHGLYEDLNAGTSRSVKPKVFLVADPDKQLEIIPFLEDSLQKVEALLGQIINNESRLR